MRKLLTTIAVAALMAGIASTASATEGWYLRGDAGYTVEGEADFDGGATFDMEEDWMAAAGVGYAWQNNFRTEAEFSYRDNELTPAIDVTSYALMGNLFYDFNRGGRFEPYVGVGIGYADPEFNDPAPEIAVDGGLAYQAMAGVAIALSERLDLDVGYRYFQTDDLDFAEGLADGQVQYNHQAVTVGLRYQLGAPAAAPVPVTPRPQPQPQPQPQPAACPTGNHVVYFEWDRSNLNAAATEVIDRAVEQARRCNINGITLVGHTDRSGSNAYNQALSERRASVVRDALVARGISAGSITTQARGETELAQQTADGVREPLNRRTAITITFR